MQQVSANRRNVRGSDARKHHRRALTSSFFASSASFFAFSASFLARSASFFAFSISLMRFFSSAAAFFAAFSASRRSFSAFSSSVSSFFFAFLAALSGCAVALVLAIPPVVVAVSCCCCLRFLFEAVLATDGFVGTLFIETGFGLDASCLDAELSEAAGQAKAGRWTSMAGHMARHCMIFAALTIAVAVDLHDHDGRRGEHDSCRLLLGRRGGSGGRGRRGRHGRVLLKAERGQRD